MKKIIAFIIITLVTLPMYAQDITGQWNGILNVQGTQLRLVFNITQADKGYSSTMDSPDQGTKGIPVTSTSYENSILKLEISNADIQYEGTLDKKNVFVGTFKQSGQSFPLNLTKEEIEKKLIIRPQEPTKPYSYYSEDVTFKNIKDKIVLAGTLTLPEKDGNFPAVVLISGSGPQNRDEEIMGHKPFLVLANHLTKNGIAVLRFDDRGTAESKGDFATATSLDFATDVKSAIIYLQTRKEINKNQIGLIGHSEGGIIAPIVAAETKEISFIILLAGTGIRGDQLLLLQQELIGKSMGVSEGELQETRSINKAAFDIVIKSTDTETLKTELTNYIKQTLKDNPEPENPVGMSEADFIKLQVDQLTSRWIQYFIKYDPSPTLEKVKCPVLAINGEKDLQVSAKVNLEAIERALVKGGNKNITIKELPNLNHLFQECETGSPSEYATTEQTFSPIALTEITNWIIRQVK